MKKEDIARQPWFFAVKAGTRELIREFGGLVAVSRFLGCSEALVGNWNNRNLPDLMPIPEMILLEADIGRPVLSRVYAVLAGGSVTDPMPQGPAGSACIMSAAAGMVKEFGEFTGSYAAALQDGKIDEREESVLRRDVIDIRDQADKVLGAMDQRRALRLVEKTGGAS